MTSRPTPATGRAPTGESTEPTLVGAEPEGIMSVRQRFALRVLDGFAYPVELHTLAAHVVTAREGVPADTVGDEVRERMAIRLHHIDIPVLIEAGLVDYDPESRMAVSLDTHAEERYTGVEGDSRRCDVA